MRRQAVLAGCCAASLLVVAAETAPSVDLGEVTVEGTPISKYRAETVNTTSLMDVPPEEYPATVDVLTADFIREHDPKDIHDLLHYEPGIFNGGKTLMAASAGTYNIRGMGGSELMINGALPAAGPAMCMYADATLLERVEIAKGPVGGTQGGITQSSGGAGGSINLVMKQAKLDEEFINAGYRASIGRHFQRHKLSWDINEPIVTEKFALRLPGSVAYNRPYYVPSDYRMGENYSIAPSILLAVREDLRIGVDTLFQYSDQPGYQGIPIYKGKPYDSYGWYSNPGLSRMRDVYQAFSIMPWLEYDATDWLTLRTGAGIAHSDIDYEHLGPGNFWQTNARTKQSYLYTADSYYEQQAGDYIANTYSAYERATAKYSLEPVNFTTVVQGDYQRRRYEGDQIGPRSTSVTTPRPDLPSPSTFTHTHTDVQRWGLLGQEWVEWSIFRLLGGIRYDYHESQSGNTGNSWSPRGGLSIMPKEWLVLYGNISMTESPNFGYLKNEKEELTSSWQALQYETGVRVSPVRDFWLGTAFFHINQDHLPTLNADGTYYEEEGEHTSKGWEVSASGNIMDNWSAYLAYTYIWYKDQSEGRVFDRYPPHSLIGSTSYRIKGGWFDDIVVGGGYRFRDKYNSTMRGSYVGKDFYIASSHVFDCSVEIPMKKFGGPKDATISLACRNIFDERYIESNRHYYQCFPGDPRTFEVALNFKF